MKTRPCSKCGRQAIELHHVHGHFGEYCSACKPEAAPYRDPFTEDVRGIVIGEVTTRFEFWSTDNRTKIARYDTTDTDTALAWFRQNYPADFASGVLMRTYEG